MTIKFSKLLKVFKLNKNNAYIIELDNNGKMENYISYGARERRKFILFDNCKEKEKIHFNSLSKTCLLNECKDTSLMFFNAPITHFEAELPLLENASHMFSYCKLDYFNLTNTPHLKNISGIFWNAQVYDVTIESTQNLRIQYSFLRATANNVKINAPLINTDKAFSNSKIKKVNVTIISRIITYSFEESNIEEAVLFFPDCYFFDGRSFKNATFKSLRVEAPKITEFNKIFPAFFSFKADYAFLNFKNLNKIYSTHILEENINNLELNTLKNNDIVKFSKLLKVFYKNYEMAYVVELIKNDKKEIYLSHLKNEEHNSRTFEKINKKELKNNPIFKDLSNECIFNKQTHCYSMFENSPLTHFDRECPNLEDGSHMFANSNLSHFSSNTPNLKRAIGMFENTHLSFIENKNFSNVLNADYMFRKTKIKEADFNFNSLIYANYMFSNSFIESFTINSSNLKESNNMFAFSALKNVKIKSPKILKAEENKNMFKKTREALKKNHPYFFV